VMALVTVRRGAILFHRRWTIRSFAMVFTLVTLYALILGFAALGFSTERAYVLSHYIAVPLNLVVAEPVARFCLNDGLPRPTHRLDEHACVFPTPS
jgi:hypothetical protein